MLWGLFFLAVVMLLVGVFGNNGLCLVGGIFFSFITFANAIFAE